MATFVPEESGQLAEELLKAAVGLMDVGFILWLSDYAKGERQQRLLSFSVGWAAAQSLFTRVVSLWQLCGRLEFSWEPMLLAVGAGPSFLVALSLVACTFLHRSLGRGANAPQRYLLSAAVAAVGFPLLRNASLAAVGPGVPALLIECALAAATAYLAWLRWQEGTR